MIERKTVSQCILADYCRGWNDAVDMMNDKFTFRIIIPKDYGEDEVLCWDGRRYVLDNGDEDE